MTVIQKREIMSLFIHVLKKVWVQNNITPLWRSLYEQKQVFLNICFCVPQNHIQHVFWVIKPFNFFALKNYVYMYRHLLYTGPF